MKDYVVRYVPKFKSITSRNRKEWGVYDAKTGVLHSRPDYSDIELACLCRWLNERNNGYLTRIKLTEY